MISAEAIHGGQILIVDDRQSHIDALAGMLAASGYRHVTWTTDAQAVLALHTANSYDLILLDMHMPGMSGLQVMRQLQDGGSDHYLPVAIITGDPGSKLAALRIGARDFILKPYDFAELEIRIRNLVETRLLYKASQANCRHQENLAMHDELTGLPNRRLLKDRIAVAIEQARRHVQFMAVMYMDLDRFKEVNDQYGHAAGDRLLISVADRLRQILRQEDTVARIGGDEFVIVLSGVTSLDDVTRPASHILDALKEPFYLEQAVIRSAASLGIAFFPADGQDAERLLASADAALYQAKRTGESRYALAGMPVIMASCALTI